MNLIDTDDLISVTEASKIGVTGLVRSVEQGHDRGLLRNNKPVAAIVSMEHLDRLQRIQEDLIDVSMAMARSLAAGPQRHSLDDVLAQFGYRRSDLSDIYD